MRLELIDGPCLKMHPPLAGWPYALAGDPPLNGFDITVTLNGALVECSLADDTTGECEVVVAEAKESAPMIEKPEDALDAGNTEVCGFTVECRRGLVEIVLTPRQDVLRDYIQTKRNSARVRAVYAGAPEPEPSFSISLGETVRPGTALATKPDGEPVYPYEE